MFSRLQKIGSTFFTRRPLLANCAIYGSLYVVAELSQQIIKNKILAQPPREIDKPTIGRYAIMGTCIFPPILYNWYKWLDKAFPGTVPRIIVKKLILDQFLLTPPLLVIFFTGMSIMEGVPNIFDECQQKFIPTFTCSCLFWLPVQTINFIFIPPRFRITYMAICAFAWVNILCLLKRKELIKAAAATAPLDS